MKFIFVFAATVSALKLPFDIQVAENHLETAFERGEKAM